jgi:transcriptional regulator with XRE-family HTH domain
MIIGDRLRALREQTQLSQGDIEKRTGLLRCYISRVENGHTVPAIETLEKLARAMETPLYQLFYDGDEPPKLPSGRSAKRVGAYLPNRQSSGCRRPAGYSFCPRLFTVCQLDVKSWS